MLSCSRMKKKLTARQHEILAAYHKNITLKPPTVRALAAILNTSPANVHQHLDAIRRKGWLEDRKSA